MLNSAQRGSGGTEGKLKRLIVASAIVLLLVSSIMVFVLPINFADENKGTPFYFGVSFCGNTTAEARLLIDRVHDYTNLFVLQSWPISRNETTVYEVCDYAVAQGLNIIVNLGTKTDNANWTWQLQVWKNGNARWGDKFLGAYYDDEPGGAQIDYDWTTFLENFTSYIPRNSSFRWRMVDVQAKWLDWKVNGTLPQDYDAETEVFLGYFARNTAFQELKSNGVKTFISDYTLHWFDYLGGYDVVLAQFGSNNSITQAIQQVRGAARMQDKEWGAILTWKYMQPPYLGSGKEIYSQMVTAYQAGAKYVILFDYPQVPDNPYGVLKNEHFAALEEFSKTVKKTSNTRTIDYNNATAVLVLPQNYGFGLRRADDRIWGYWGPDHKTAQVWNASQTLLARYGLQMDIIYDDSAYLASSKYGAVYFWNQTFLPSDSPFG